MPQIFFILSFFLLTNFGNYLFAQSSQEIYFEKNIEQHQFDDTKYNSLTEGINYSEEKKEKEKKEEKERSEQQFEGIGPILKFTIIILGIVLIAFLLIKALTGDNIFSPSDKKIKPLQIDLEKIEENLENAELEDPIKQAISDGNYSLATRLYYLFILKELSLQKKITWKKDKTNGEYLRELAGSPFFKTIQETTLVFEKIWYGKMIVSEQDFLTIEPIFLQTIETIKSN